MAWAAKQWSVRSAFKPRLPLHASSLGKAILAFSPEQTIDDLLDEPLARLPKHTLDAAALRAEFATIRDQGIATERDEAVLGESSAAAPIFDHAGSAVGAIGVVDSTERVFPKGLGERPRGGRRRSGSGGLARAGRAALAERRRGVATAGHPAIP